MTKRLVLYGVLAAALALILGGTGRVEAFPPPQLQNFEQYQITCLGGDDVDLGTLPLTCPGPENKNVDATPGLVSGSILPEGNRLQLGYSYLGPGWPEGTTTVDGETVADNRTPQLDYFCDGVVDMLAPFAWVDTTATTQQALTQTVGSGQVISVSDASLLPDPGTDGVYIRIESTISGSRTKTETMVLTAKDEVGDTMTVTRFDPSAHLTGARIDEPDDPAAPGFFDFVMRTTAWGTGTGIDGEDESYLDEILPSSHVGTVVSRARAAYTHFWYGGATPFEMGSVPVNSVGIAPVWQPDAEFSVVTFAGGPGSPTPATIGCTQSPQAGEGHNRGQYAPNPATAGLYARWTASMGELDYSNGVGNFVYTTNCKAIGGSVTDADDDCLADTANDGHPGVADPNDSNPDIDGDGLLDGIEVAFGTCPGIGGDFDSMAVCSGVSDTTDTDGDGFNDLEEMIGPSYNLTVPANWQATTLAEDVDSGETEIDVNDATNISVGHTIIIGSDEMDVTGKAGNTLTVAAWSGSAHFTNDPVLVKSDDTDGDGYNDRTLKVDMYDDDAIPPGSPDEIQDTGSPDGIPDFPDQDGDYVVDSGIGPNWDSSGDGSSNVRVGYVITGSPTEDVDNCPNIANAGQENSDDDASGDACDPDDDNDGMTDAAEATFKWDDVEDECSNDPATVTPLDRTNPDFDGDGFLDGQECKLGSNPDDITSKPTADLSGDKDGLSEAQETAFHISPFSLRSGASEDVDGDGDVGNDDRDSDGDGITDGCEIAFSNTLPLNRMSAAGTPDMLRDGARPEVQEIGNGKGGPDPSGPYIADDTTVAASNYDGFNCDDDADNDGRSNSDELNGTGTGVCDGVITDWGVDPTYDDDNDGNPCAGSLGGTDSWEDSGVDITENMDAGVVDENDDFPGTQTLVDVDDATGLAGYGLPQPIRIESEEMTLLVVTGDGPGLMRDQLLVTRAASPVAHSAGQDVEVRDDPPSWDTDGDTVLDGVECLGPDGVASTGDETNPTDPGSKPSSAQCGGDADPDADNLQTAWEVCKWGTDPTKLDTDDDGVNDCKEVADVDGNKAVKFTTDTIYYAKASLLTAAAWGKDGDYDIDGNNAIKFTTDAIIHARLALLPGACK